MADVGTANMAVAAGYDFTLVLRADGAVWGVGWNEFGQLGKLPR
jgi:alpha-tubulin suppressor-like RCC1 family protein